MTNIQSGRIILYNKNNKNKIYIGAKLPPINSSGLEYQFNNFYSSENKRKLKNRIIMSIKVRDPVGTSQDVSVTLINKINLYHNIKFIN